MKQTAAFISVLAAWLVMPTYSKRNANAMQTHSDLIVIAIFGAVTVAAVIKDAKGR